MRYIVTRIIYAVFALVEIILALRLVLRMFGANTAAPFVNWVYETSASVLDPFRGIFPTQVFESTYVIEFSTLFAMVLYAIIAMLLIYVVELITRPLDAKLGTAVVDEPATVTKTTSKTVPTKTTRTRKK